MPHPVSGAGLSLSHRGQEKSGKHLILPILLPLEGVVYDSATYQMHRLHTSAHRLAIASRTAPYRNITVYTPLLVCVHDGGALIRGCSSFWNEMTKRGVRSSNFTSHPKLRDRPCRSGN